MKGGCCDAPVNYRLAGTATGIRQRQVDQVVRRQRNSDFSALLLMDTFWGGLSLVAGSIVVPSLL